MILYHLLGTSLLIVLYTENTSTNESGFFTLTVYGREANKSNYNTIRGKLLRGSLGCSRDTYNEGPKSKLGETENSCLNK